MNIVAWVFIALLAVVLLGALVFVVGSIPDLLRYQRIRRM
jgi:membrane protein YdbS with pleckstrin-like domain